MRLAGNSNRELMIALRTRSLDSLTVVSGSPTKESHGYKTLLGRSFLSS